MRSWEWSSVEDHNALMSCRYLYHHYQLVRMVTHSGNALLISCLRELACMGRSLSLSVLSRARMRPQQNSAPVIPG